jgi:hypothetical protein
MYMQRNRKAVVALAAAALSAAMFAGSAIAAENDSGFTALQGVTAQTLSTEEQQSISGELNATGIASWLVSHGAVKLAAEVTQYSTQINALLTKLHLYTK